LYISIQHDWVDIETLLWASFNSYKKNLVSNSTNEFTENRMWNIHLHIDSISIVTVAGNTYPCYFIAHVVVSYFVFWSESRSQEYLYLVYILYGTERLKFGKSFLKQAICSVFLSCVCANALKEKQQVKVNLNENQ